MGIGVHASSASNEWETPAFLVRQLDKLFGPFDLDPCCTEENAKAVNFFTVEDNGLKQDWQGHNVFMNPPYGRQIGKWVRKAYEESLFGGCRVTCLIPARTDTSYWHDVVLRDAYKILFIRNRIYFGDGTGRAPFPSAVVVYDVHLRERRGPILGSLVLQPDAPAEGA